MDTGTYNCRDYHITPHFSATTLTNINNNNNNNTRNAHLQRHESWADLEQRSRSPASLKPKFPLLKLPLELRQQILSYLLPHTQELGSHADALESHVRNFPAVQKRVRKGMELPPEKKVSVSPAKRQNSSSSSSNVPTNIAWRRGNTSLFAVCRQLHDECADMVYGCNTFLLGVTFSRITFRFRYVLPSGMAPQREYAFLELMPARYLHRLRRVFISVDHVDSYTGMIKYNVSGKGLVHGIRRQVLRLVCALQPVAAGQDEGRQSAAEDSSIHERPGLARVVIRISNGNTVTTSLKAQFGEVQRISQDIEEILEPFGHFCGVRDPRVVGAVGQAYARELEERMRNPEPRQPQGCCCSGGMADLVEDEKKAVQICVYGNDIS